MGELEHFDGREPAARANDLAKDNDQATEPQANELAKAAGQAALSLVLATSLSSALSEPPRAELISLAEPTPIVQVLEDEKEATPAPEPEAEDEDDRMRRILRILRFLLVALLIAGAVVFGALKGCTSCTAGLLTPDDEQQEQPEASQVASALV